MNISYKWLKEYVDFDLTPQETACALTSTGLEAGFVEEVQAVKGGLAGLVVGEVLTCVPHPGSDHLHVCTVNTGNGEPLQIVCGAPNVAAGQKVIAALPGCKLYDGDREFVIKKTRLRGTDSCGMLCAEDEIGIGNDHSGIIVLPDDAVPGTPAAEYYHLESDWVIEVDITPNRADACSHYGVARDLYAWLRQNGYATRLHRPSEDAFRADNNDLDIDVIVENQEACPCYCAVSVKGCTVGESPDWLKRRLQTVGQRPINNIVDITNYIMFAYGQPLHCFDADMIKGGKIVVRTLPEGTPFVTLDGVTHTLSDEDLVICNAEEPMCIAGVFGGKGSGTYDTTSNILFESAYFNPTWIRKSARRHGLSTDSSFRFERGIDPNGQVYALKQAAMLAKELAGGEISMQIRMARKEEPKDFIIDLDYGYVGRLVGQQISKDTVKNILSSLEIKIISEDENGIRLAVPPYRVDVKRPCDVVEDILRIYGYNNVKIPPVLKSAITAEGEIDRSNKLQNIIGEQLAGCGFNEIMNNSLTKTSYYDGLEEHSADKGVSVLNPLSSDLGMLRQTLLFGGLETIRHNANRKAEDLRFFEFGNCYCYDKTARRNTDKPLAAYGETFHLGIWLAGKSKAGSWIQAEEKADFYTLKAHVLNVFKRAGLPLSALKAQEKFNGELLGSAIVYTDRSGKPAAELGFVRRAILRKFNIRDDVFFADINWTNLMKFTAKSKVGYTRLSKFPPVSRDLALLVDSNVKFSEIERIAFSTEKRLLKKVELFDVYEGGNLPAGKKSYAVNFILEDEERTLTDEVTNKILGNLLHNLESKLGARQR